MSADERSDERGCECERCDERTCPEREPRNERSLPLDIPASVRTVRAMRNRRRVIE